MATNKPKEKTEYATIGHKRFVVEQYYRECFENNQGFNLDGFISRFDITQPTLWAWDQQYKKGFFSVELFGNHLDSQKRITITEQLVLNRGFLVSEFVGACIVAFNTH